MTVAERYAQIVGTIVDGMGLKLVTRPDGSYLIKIEDDDEYVVHVAAPRTHARVLLEGESLMATGESPEGLYDYVESAIRPAKATIAAELRALADRLDRR